MDKKGEILSNNIESVDDIKNIMTLYPNPAINYINVSLPNVETTKYKVRIYNLFGEMVKEVEFNTVPGTLVKKIDVSGLNMGTYILNLNSGKISERKKFFKL